MYAQFTHEGELLVTHVHVSIWHCTHENWIDEHPLKQSSIQIKLHPLTNLVAQIQGVISAVAELVHQFLKLAEDSSHHLTKDATPDPTKLYLL